MPTKIPVKRRENNKIFNKKQKKKTNKKTKNPRKIHPLKFYATFIVIWNELTWGINKWRIIFLT